MRSLEYPEVESKRRHPPPGWEQEDVFTELSIPLGTFGHPARAQTAKLPTAIPTASTRCHFKATC